MRIIVRYPEKSVKGKDALQRMAGVKEVALNVNPSKLRACIGYLQVHNPRLYGRVQMNEEAMADLERERSEAVAMGLNDVFRDWDDHEQRFTTTVNMDPVAPTDVSRILGTQYGKTEITRDGGPVKPHEVPDLLAQCFPSLFPSGGGNFREFQVPLTPSEMLEHTTQFGDPRFAQHLRYMFMMVNIKNLDIAYRSISTTLRGRVKKANMDGSIADVTEEMISNFSSVVCTEPIYSALCSRTLRTARPWRNCSGARTSCSAH